MGTSTTMLISGLEGCVCTCKHSGKSVTGRADFARHRVDSNSAAGSGQDFCVSINLKLSRRPRRLPVTTKCLYSPLVESFEASRIRPFTTQRDGKDGELILIPSASSLTFLNPTSETSSEQSTWQYQSWDEHVGKEQRMQDGIIPAPQDPVAAAAHGDSSFLGTASDAGHDLEARRSAKYQPPMMSLTQGFTAGGNQAINSVIGFAGPPIASAGKIRGPAGIFMGLVVAAVGIATAVQRKVGTQPQVKQMLCSRCDGYGVECCDVCGGVGRISWEGKVHRTNTCPRCFGSCLKKCPRCDGYRVKKESPPALQKLKFPPNKR